ncbi:hypothetical protein Ctob_005986 [Chrysochromulina tobinii]|uniref:Glycosyl hydrolase n=1 Tax=Chrysochromulina tobinii TaxID=1460289 RepID=A0A0M0J5X1_9EUKA|nr:hypothetical protein Ctob_005986 [Chrysochromulina tobinii]|eukprot:KOO21618.1 hypothetical protein Ctob_005986 [Chrysochromulina sp. CCMP291]
MLTAALSIFGAPTQAGADWAIKTMDFSAVTIGIAMKDEKTGWTATTNGATAVHIVKTEDGGNTWNRVANQNETLGLVMGIDQADTPFGVVTTGLDGSAYSTDGDSFFRSNVFPPDLASQSIKSYNHLGAKGGRSIMASPGGVCLSNDMGETYKCKDHVPFKYGKAGRYVAWPSPEVIYITAGSWPTESPSENVHYLSSRLRMVKRDAVKGVASVALEVGPFNKTGPVNGMYTAELWKSSDGGDTWENLISDTGNYYFNDIDCFDDKHCFYMVHTEPTDGSSLMAVKMLSEDEFHVGGRLISPSALGLHSTDGGASFIKLGAGIRGEMITSMSFPTTNHGFATSISELQVCSLLEYKHYFGATPA